VKKNSEKWIETARQWKTTLQARWTPTFFHTVYISGSIIQYDFRVRFTWKVSDIARRVDGFSFWTRYCYRAEIIIEIMIFPASHCNGTRGLKNAIFPTFFSLFPTFFSLSLSLFVVFLFRTTAVGFDDLIFQYRRPAPP